MEVKIGDIVVQKKDITARIGIVLKIIDHSHALFPTADILYANGAIGWSYLMDLKVISFIEIE